MAEIQIPPHQFIESNRAKNAGADGAGTWTGAELALDTSLGSDLLVAVFPDGTDTIIQGNIISPPDTSAFGNSWCILKSSATGANTVFVFNDWSGNTIYYTSGGVVDSVTQRPIELANNQLVRAGLNPVKLAVGNVSGNQYWNASVIRKPSSKSSDISTADAHLLNMIIGYTSNTEMKDSGYLWISANSFVVKSGTSNLGFFDSTKPWSRSMAQDTKLQVTFTIPPDYNGGGTLRVYVNDTPNHQEKPVQLSAYVAKKTPCDNYSTALTLADTATGNSAVNSSNWTYYPNFIDLDLTSVSFAALDTVTIQLTRNVSAQDQATGNIRMEGCYFMYNKASWKQASYLTPNAAGGTATSALQTSDDGTKYWASTFSNGVNEYISVPAIETSYLYKRNPLLRVRWRSDSTNDGDVAFMAVVGSIAQDNSEVIAFEVTGDVVNTTYLGTDILHDTEISLLDMSDFIAKDSTFILKLFRMSTDVSDTLADDIDVIDVILQYDAR